MVIRLTTKMATKVKVRQLEARPLSDAPLEDWSIHVFSSAQIQYVIATNTASLYSVVFPGKGITDQHTLIDSLTTALEELTPHDGIVGPDWSSLFGQQSLTFAKSLNRSVTGSVNDHVHGSKHYLKAVPDMELLELSMRLNESPMSMLEYANPRKVFIAKLGTGQD